MEIIPFPSRDFVSIAGYKPGAVLRVEIYRRGILTGRSKPIRRNAEGLWEVNHPGGAGWAKPSTPNLMPGDVLKVRNLATGRVESTFVQGVAVSEPGATAVGTTVTMHGTARDLLTGGRPPLSHLEARLIEPALQDTVVGRRDVRAPQDPGRNGITGTLRYDGATSNSWTATWTGFPDGATASLAAGGENRVLWLGRGNPATTGEITIFELINENGPGIASSAPAAKGAYVDLKKASDTGLSASDNITGSTELNLRGVTGNLGPGSTIDLMVDGNSVATLPSHSTTGLYAHTLTLSPGTHVLRATETKNGATEGPGDPLRVTIDQVKPKLALRSLRPPTFDPSQGGFAKAVYGLSEASRVSAKVVSASGRTVKRFPARMIRGAKLVEYHWNATIARGRSARPGAYRLILRAQDLAGNITLNKSARIRVTR